MLFFSFNEKWLVKVFLTPIIFLIINTFINAQVGTQIALNPLDVPQFVDPLPHFAGLRVNAKAGGDLTVKMVTHQQIAVSTGTVLATGTVGPATPNVGLANFWVYQISYEGGTFTPPMWPAFTIEAERDVNGSKALNVTYQNLLYGASYSDVGLIVDETLHWADPDGFVGSDPPTVVHLHGGEVAPLSDGGPDSWFTPDNTKTGHAFNNNPYVYPNTQEAATLWFHDHALGVTRLNVYAGLAGFYFLRGADEETAHLPGWSGDDLVLEAAGGFAATRAYLPEIEIVIQDRMFDTEGKLYFPNVGINPEHPQWVPEFEGDIITVNGKTWPYLSVAPRKYRFRFLNGSNARFYELWLQDLATGVMGPVINQIGTDGGLLDAPVTIDPNIGGKLILGPGERADVVIDFSAYAGANPPAVWTLRNSGHTPFPKGPPPNGRTIGRIMQFVVNGTMVDGEDVNTTAEDNSELPASLRSSPIVNLTNNWTTLPNPTIPGLIKARQLTLNEVMGPGGPLEVLVNNTRWGGKSIATDVFTDGVRGDFEAVTNTDLSLTYYSETTDEGKTEIWKIVNLTADAHPIHLHLVQFQLLSRQKFNFNKYNKVYNALFPPTTTTLDPMTGQPYPGGVFIGGYGPPKSYDFYATGTNIPPTGPIYGGNPDITPYLQGPMKPANPNERGWKDTFIMYPGEVTTVIARWAPTDKAANLDPTDEANEMWFPFNPNGGHGYVWHCHIIDHEDNEMMRPYNVNPNPEGPWALTKQSGETPIASVVDFSLEQNFPNPFNPSTAINFSIPNENTLVNLKIYNSLGEEVGILLNQVVPAGNHKVYFDASGLPSAVYFYRLQAGDFVETKKMVLMK
jgi:FtsP/CotA-like multicopper oxidase with cupredoxin domain